MTRDDIIRMARGAAFDTYINLDSHLVGILLQRFATLVSSYEREECAKIADEYGKVGTGVGGFVAAAIRARGNK